MKLINTVLVGLSLMGLYGCASTSLVASTAEQDRAINTIALNGAEFHVQTFGDADKPVVIVLHGGPGNDFRYLLPLQSLADDYFVVFYDQRGTGLSPRVPAEQHSLEQTISDLAAMVDHFSPAEPVNIIAHSWGAMFASGYMGQYPERINKIVLAEPGFLTPEQADVFLARTKIRMTPTLLWHASKIWLRSLSVSGPDDQARDDFMMDSLMRLDVKNHPMAGYFCLVDGKAPSMEYWRSSKHAMDQIVKGAMNEDGGIPINFADQAKRYQNKVLMITGECNQISGTEHQQRHLALFNNIELVEIKDAGHTMFSEQAEVSEGIVRKYFAE